MPITWLFQAEVKLNERPAYQIAKAAGIHPTTLSQILSGRINIRQGDRRVLAVAKFLNKPMAELFPEDRN